MKGIKLSSCSENCSAKRQKLAANEFVVGRFIPTCDENGNYQPLQTHGSTGERWCVDINDRSEVADTRVYRTQPDPVCSKGKGFIKSVNSKENYNALVEN